MLRKLLKYDLKANYRVFLVMYAVVLVIAAGTRVSMNNWMENFGDSGLSNAVAPLLLITYGVALIALNILAVVLIVRRFYLNLFGSEGYLSFTLPVTAVQHLLSKVISAVIWVVCSVVVQGLSLLILIIGETDWGTIARGIEEFWDIFGRIITARDVIMQGLLGIVGLLASLLMVYFAVCLGQLVNRHRVVAAVAIFFGLNFLEGIINRLLTNSFVNYNMSFLMGQLINYDSMYYVFRWMFLAIRLVIYGAGAVLLMKKKLNLE